MGAEMIAERYGFMREQLDEYALLSHQRAAAAARQGAFQAEILPVAVRSADGGGEDLHVQDEGIRFDASLAGIGAVKLLREGGVVTAASASQICDGAAGVMVCSERGLQASRRRDRARPPARRLGRQADDHAGARAAPPWQRLGLQTMCEGGGMANVTIVERV